MRFTRSLLQASLWLSVPALLAGAERSPFPHGVPPELWATNILGAGSPDPARAALQRAVEAVYPALVRIHVVTEEGQDGRMQKYRASGSGTIISEEGYIITNHHVSGRATRIVCRLSNREEVDAVLVGSDPLTDIAIIKLDLSTRRDPKAKLPVAQFGDSEALQVGDAVLAMGSPAGVSQSVTRGIVANTAMISPGNAGGLILDGERVGELVRWIGHDAAIFPGNSGGPLVNLRGQIVGINEVGIGSLGGAIPSNLAQAIARELIAKGRIARSWIGLEVQPLLKQQTDAKGILVSAVLPDSPAQAAGIQPGDFITSVAGKPVLESRAPEDIPMFNRLVVIQPIGAKLLLAGTRAGKALSWSVTTADREPNLAREAELLGWGLTVRDLTRVAALERYRPTKQGVMVDSVRPGGPSAECKPPLRPDDIITQVAGHPVTNVADLRQFTRRFTQDSPDPKPVVVTFERETQEFITVARVGPEVIQDKPERPAKAWMGVQTQVLTRDLADMLDLEGKKGIRVTQVLPGSPAEKAGVKVGDIFLKLDGQVIPASTPSDQELFDNLIRQYKVGGDAVVEGVRAGQPLQLTIVLGRQPKPNSDLKEYKDDRFEFTAREMSLLDRVESRLADREKGLRIGAVQNAGWAALAGLAYGDILLAVDGQPVESIAALKTIMSHLRENKPRRVVFYVKRGIRTQFIELEPQW